MSKIKLSNPKNQMRHKPVVNVIDDDDDDDMDECDASFKNSKDVF